MKRGLIGLLLLEIGGKFYTVGGQVEGRAGGPSAE
jgi:hypothetical protein